MCFEFDYVLKPSEVENSYQHLHHADALKILELARLELLNKINFSLESFLKRDLFLVISKIQIAYKREVRPGDLKVISKNISVEGKELIIPQFLYNEKQKLAIEAEIRSVVMCGKTKRGLHPDPKFIQALLAI